MTATPERSMSGPVEVTALAEAAFRALFDAAGDAIVIFDVRARCIAANDAAAALLGYSVEELRTLQLSDLLMIDSVRAATAYQQLLRSGRMRAQIELRHKLGTPVLVESVAARVDLPGGPVSMAILRDIDERRAGEASERARAERIRQITDALPVLISYVDANERYLFLNIAYQEWFGRPRREMLGRPIGEVVGPDAYAQILPYVQQALRGERVTYETEVLFHDGRRRDITATYVPHQEPDGTVLGFFALVTDSMTS
jgi:PAS domain S-box-containing protein